MPPQRITMFAMLTVERYALVGCTHLTGKVPAFPTVALDAVLNWNVDVGETAGKASSLANDRKRMKFGRLRKTNYQEALSTKAGDSICWGTVS